MRFLGRHPVALRDLLVSPIVFRERHPALAGTPLVSAALLHDLARCHGHRDGAVRTALSRLRAEGKLEAVEAAGAVRYVLGALGRSVASVVGHRPARPDGLVLAVFSFSTGDARERHVVRESLKLHGFQKLAQNVYVNGLVDTSGIEEVVREHGLDRHVFLFRCDDRRDPVFDAKMAELFGIAARAKVLERFERDLAAFVGEPGLTPDERARRILAAAPVHYRVTFVEEPPLPRRCLPPGYPLARLESFGRFTRAEEHALRGYFGRFEPDT